MVNPDLSQPTERSGSFLAHPPQLHGANATTAPGDAYHEPLSIPFMSLGEGCLPSPPTIVDEPESFTDSVDKMPGYSILSQPLPSLQLRTDMDHATDHDSLVHQSLSQTSLPKRTPSLRAILTGPNSSTGSLSPASVLSSPQLTAMADITPLPSPINGMSPWRLPRSDSQSLSRSPSNASRTGSISLRLSDSSHQMFSRSASRSRAKPYASLDKVGEQPSETSKPRQEGVKKHVRNRSLSEYVPPVRGVPIKPRPIVVSGSGPLQGMLAPSSSNDSKNNLHREHYLAVHRGIALPTVSPPTPPRSSRSECSDNEQLISSRPFLDVPEQTFFVRSIRSQQPRKYRKLRQLGQGTFSQVCLAVRLELGEDGDASDGSSMNGAVSETQKLVAVKIIEYGPAGGADEERLEVSLKREVDILRKVNHPSLVQLKAFGSDEKRALLVLDYCPGGDLFDVASSGLKTFSPALIRRIFAEMVSAVRYLHQNFIVHRDIKLENVLVTLPIAALEKISDWRTYDRAIVTLSDLGLSRRIPEPPESPLLQTRCGSEDYAAPEILMGQPYDGRATDAWALGVLLYAIMENRLPFDALPGTRGDPAKLRARTPHRIARCEWSWYRYADADEEWDPVKGKDLEGARLCVEGLLKRNTKRKSLNEIASMEWVRDAIDVPEGLKRGDKEVP